MKDYRCDACDGVFQLMTETVKKVRVEKGYKVDDNEYLVQCPACSYKCKINPKKLPLMLLRQLKKM